MRALVVGGTRFLGRHTVEEFLANGYEVTTFNRGEHPDPFADDDRVDRVAGDRTNDSALEAAAMTVDPDVVVDCVAYEPRDVRAATEIFADVEAYVYVSSGAVYERDLPKREGETPLVDYPGDEAGYGQKKAEGDRAVVAAADRGVPATSVRPPVIYGPHDYTGRFGYWVDRVAEHDRVVVPGDGQNLWHRAYVADVARGLRVVAEAGTPGTAYNVGDRRLTTLAELVGRIADALDTEIEVVTASERELSVADLSPGDFPLYRSYPHVLDTSRIAALDWEATPVDDAVAATVAAHEAGHGRDQGPGRETERRVLDVLDTL